MGYYCARYQAKRTDQRLPPMDTDKRTMKNDIDSNRMTNTQGLSYYLSVLLVFIGGNLEISSRYV